MDDGAISEARHVPATPISRKPRLRRLWWSVGFVLVAVVSLGVVSTFVHLRVPAPTGDFAVGRGRASWIDPRRAETNTPSGADRREVPVLVWYPADEDTGNRASYVPDLPHIRDALVASGAVNGFEASGLRLVRDRALEGALISAQRDRYPVVLLSPGSLTNVSFYASLAEDLASHGYIVIGIDHPYSVAAVRLRDGSVASASSDSPVTEEMIAADVQDRAADIRFVLDRLERSTSQLAFLDGRVDLERIGVMGHSLGGIAAVEACRVDSRLGACLNVDGQQAGGPFSTDPAGTPPDQPFMYLTKEIELHPELDERFEAAGIDAFRVVVPAASHEDFTDGSLFEPSLVPWARTPEDVIKVTRGFSAAFFDHALGGESVEVFAQVDAPTDVYVNIYPLGKASSLP